MIKAQQKSSVATAPFKLFSVPDMDLVTWTAIMVFILGFCCFLQTFYET